MKPRLRWGAAMALILTGGALFAPKVSEAQTNGFTGNSAAQPMTGFAGQTTVRPTMVPFSGTTVNTGSNWWSSWGPPSDTRFDPTYGWVTTVHYADGSWISYTYGFQVFFVWTASGYRPVVSQGAPGVAYPAVFGPRP